MNIKLRIIILGILFSFNVFADGYIPEFSSLDQPWSITASFGTGKYQHINSKDGQRAVGRVAVNNEMMLSGDYALGLELGFQSGNHMRVTLPKETLAVLEWLPVRSSLGPMLDLLITAKSDPLGNSSFFAQLKGGVAYRHWQIKNEPVYDLSQLAGEIQAGFGYPITALAHLSLLYQGVFGSDPNFQVNAFTKTAQVSNIPVLHAVLLGFTVNL